MRTGEHVLAAVLVVALAGCSDPPAAPLPSTSPSTPTSTPSPTASTDYAAEARQAIDAYFAALNAALRDPANRTDALAALIDPACPCRQVLALLRDLADDGHYIDYRYTVSDVRIQQAGSLGASMTWTAAQSAGAERTSEGRVVESFPARTSHYSAHFRRGDGAWLLDRLDRMT